MARKNVSIRLDEELLNEVDRLNETRTKVIESALQLYLNRDAGASQENISGNVDDYISFLQDQIKELNRLLDQQQKIHYQDIQQLEDRRTEKRKKEGLSLWQRFINWWKE